MLDFFNQSPNSDKLKTRKIARFGFVISLTPYTFDDIQREKIQKAFLDAVLMSREETKMLGNSLTFSSDLFVQTNGNNVSEQKHRAKDAWCTIGYKEPGSEFELRISDNEVSLVCVGLKLESLVNFLCSQGEVLIKRIIENSAVNELFGISSRAVDVHYSFRSIFRVGERLNRSAGKNHDVISQAFSLDPGRKPKKGFYPENAFAELATEEVVRFDIKRHALKEIRGQTYVVKLTLEAPYNEKNSILDLNATISMEEDFGFVLDKATNFSIALFDFYRDLILERFIPNLFAEVEWEIN